VTLTDEQLAAIEKRLDCGDAEALVAEIRRLRAEVARLEHESTRVDWAAEPDVRRAALEEAVTLLESSTIPSGCSSTVGGFVNRLRALAAKGRP
jgi:hypothetical protein